MPDREAFVDLGAITANVAALGELVRGSQVLAAAPDGPGADAAPVGASDLVRALPAAFRSL